jgi:hypothetical protein
MFTAICRGISVRSECYAIFSTGEEQQEANGVKNSKLGPVLVGSCEPHSFTYLSWPVEATTPELDAARDVI